MVTVTFDLPMGQYNGDGYWKDAYDPEFSYWVIGVGYNVGVFFSHQAEVTEYDGVEYKSYTGFVPTIVDDQADHSDDDWTKYQFGCMAPTNGQGFAVAHWDVRENETTTLENRSCLIDFVYSVRPVALSITNTTYAYWAMLKGTAFSKPFTTNDYLAVDIWGVDKGKETFYQTVYLAENGDIVDSWQSIDLTGMGEVQQIYFTMRSSDSGEWGMNTPAYFALGALQVVYPGTSSSK